MNLANKIHRAYSDYGNLEYELFDAIEAIVGEGNVEDSHVECDSVYDSSVEIVMADGVALTQAHLLALAAPLLRWRAQPPIAARTSALLACRYSPRLPRLLWPVRACIMRLACRRKEQDMCEASS